MEKLKQPCDDSWFPTKVKEVLDKTVECALAVHKEYVVDNAKWEELDIKFVTAILAITQNGKKGRPILG
jgi:hypothetical protein